VNVANALKRSVPELRPYQSAALDSIAKHFFDHQITRPLVVLPTGTGKTVLFAALPQQEQIAAWLNTYDARRRKILILAHRELLLDQAANKVTDSNPSLFVEIEQGNRRASPSADVVIASVQTLIASNRRRLQNLNPDDFRIVITDEAHHGCAKSYERIYQYFRFMPPDDFMKCGEKETGRRKDAALQWQRNRLQAWDKTDRPDRFLLGVTATPKRGDNVGLEAVFQRIIFHRSLRDMIESGYLSRLRAIRVRSETNLDAVHSVAGDFDQGELGEAVDNEGRNKLIVSTLKKYCTDRKGVIFTVTVKHAHDVAGALLAAGRKAAAISGAMPMDERRQILKDFHDGTIQDLVNCMVLTEGFDEPNIQYILHAKPTKSSLLYIQMSGRGTRLAPGKKDTLIIDIVDVTRRHSLVTMPDLFGLPVNFDVQGDDILNVVKKVEEIKAKLPSMSLEGANSLNDIKVRAEEVDLFATAANHLYNDEVKKHAKLFWACEGDDHYSITWRGDFNDERVDLRQNLLGHWEASHTDFKAKQLGDSFLDLPSAFVEGERWLKNNYPELSRMKAQNAPWRKDPASDGQLKYLKTLKIQYDKAKLGASGGKGLANDLIEAWKRMR
jgi:superfamily II DNA or RNA helicase